MITIFGTTRKFTGHFGLIQGNALASWIRLSPQPQVLIMGNENGTAEVCAELGITHVPNIECNDFGTPLVNSMIEQAEDLAQFNLMLLVSTDIVLFNDTMEAAGIASRKFKRFCAVVTKRDLDITKPIDFENPHWEQEIRGAVKDIDLPKNELAGGDFFLFPKGYWVDFPPFAIGRTMVDNWMFYRALSNRGVLLDLSPTVTIVHQRHDHSHHPQGVEGVYGGEEHKYNLKLAGGYQYALFISDANWILTPQGLKKRRLRGEYLDRYLNYILPILFPRLGKLYFFLRRLVLYSIRKIKNCRIY